jgi:cobalt-zinc-cadmium efflux system outer membrane protein
MRLRNAIALRVMPACLGLLVAVSGASAAELGADVGGLLEHARANSPELRVMRHEAAAAAERIGPSRALPDPVLRVELENIGNEGNGGGFNLLPGRVGETKYTVMQPLPAWGKRDLRRDVAQADATQAYSRVDAAWSDLAMRIKTAFAQYYLADGSARLTAEVLDLMSQLERIAQARYAGGLVAQQDAIRAQIEQTAMRTDLVMLDNEKRQWRARLNALLGRGRDAPLADPRALRAMPPAAALAPETLAQRALGRNPQLQAEAARVRGAESNRELVRRNRWPDFQVGVSPTQMGSRIAAWGLMVELNIPLQQGSRRAQERESEAMVQAARSRAQALATELDGELAQATAGLEAARRTEDLLGRQLLPQSEVGTRAALAAYENGRVDFATVVESQRQIRKARQDLLKAQAEARMRLAEMERIVGEDL